MKEKGKWSCIVTKLSGTNNYRTVFTVGVQSFILAQDGGRRGDPEPKQHCEFIRDQFIAAMATLGMEEEGQDE